MGAILRKIVSVCSGIVGLVLLIGPSGVVGATTATVPQGAAVIAAEQERSTTMPSRSFKRLDCMMGACPLPSAKPSASPSPSLALNHACSEQVKAVWSGPCPPAPSKAQVQAMMWEAVREAGWGNQTQFDCLNELIDHESDWMVYAVNSSSKAYGLPQALPGKKMASAGADWGWNPRTQLRWMMNYLRTDKDYGTPCAAWAWWQRNHWY